MACNCVVTRYGAVLEPHGSCVGCGWIAHEDLWEFEPRTGWLSRRYGGELTGMANILVRLTQRLLSNFDLRIARVSPCVEPLMPFDVLELAISYDLKEKDQEFFFVQVGASGGISDGVLGRLIRMYQLPGCFVAPADRVDTLKHSFRDQPQIDFRGAVGDPHGAPSDLNEAHGAAQPSILIFQSFIAELPVKQISMLSIEGEGRDDEVIDAAFRAGIFPPIVNYEWTEMPVERRCELKMRLLDHGYRFIDVGSYTVCRREEHAYLEG